MEVHGQQRGPAIQIDAERWPLIYVRWIGAADGPMVDAYLRELTQVITTRPGKRVIVMDASECGMVSAAARKKQGDWLTAFEQSTRAFTAGVAFVLPSPLLRGALTAVLWLQPLACPYAVVKDEATALERCRAWLAPFGLRIPQ